MNFEEAMKYISSLGMSRGKPGLDGMRRLMAALGDPQEKLRFVHVAGTNGKGSACAMLESILRAAGYRTGLFTSPYLRRFNERIRVNGRSIDDGELAAVCERVREAADSLGGGFCEFEIDTAMAFCHFARCKCGVVVLEVGLGGRLDPTNIIPCPDCAVIMNIGLDHTAILGGTLREIAAEKAGIIKPGGSVAMYEPEDDEVMSLAASVCRQHGASLRIADFCELELLEDGPGGQRFCYCDDVPLSLPLLGDHQLRNAAVVLEAVEILREAGFRIKQDAVEKGLASTFWPARFELVSSRPPVVVDGGHNPQCAAAVAGNMKYYFDGMKRVCLMGVMRDKDYESMAEIMAGAADVFVCVTPPSPRALPAEELGKLSAFRGKPVFICPDVREGVRTALGAAGENGALVCMGSLYMAAELRDFFGAAWL